VRTKKGRRGFTLVEVMVAMAIFMMISGIILTVIVAGFRSFNQGQTMAPERAEETVCFLPVKQRAFFFNAHHLPGKLFQGR